ncbi:conjugative transposon protein TraM [Chitinophaga barathri]|uniref:Conjugative transposon protein TraM n=1 Tax=Chitinophaga barathri TaxID=1647451 RepID=A0A3N4M7A3_9BACT|nr:conjugative transposon protein TraM [Chitinophaga barathri]RPD39344.1 conjugative transposon protein TraM [Chitinophaga barathri]
MKSEVENVVRRQRRFMLVLPAIVVPFLGVIFFILGGGGAAAVANNQPKGGGLKMQLPDVSLKGTPEDKLSYYQRAADDSMKRSELLRMDPYQAQNPDGRSENFDLSPGREFSGLNGLSASGSDQMGGGLAAEKAIYERIATLQTSINSSPADTRIKEYSEQAPGAAAEMDRLQALVEGMKKSETKPDPEMTEINGMLDRILDIQHPDRIQERYKEESRKNKGQVFSVKTNVDAENITVLSNKVYPGSGSGFYGLQEESAPDELRTATIPAVIHETQTLVNGAVVKMRLVNDIYVNGVKIPKDCFIHGLATLTGERLEIKIENIQYANSLFPVNLAVYDLDGIAGVHIPDAISRNVAKQSGIESLQGLGTTTLDPSLAAQAATAGIELTKNFIGKKVKLVRVTVKAGYKILLQDENQKEN